MTPADVGHLVRLGLGSGDDGGDEPYLLQLLHGCLVT